MSRLATRFEQLKSQHRKALVEQLLLQCLKQCFIKCGKSVELSVTTFNELYYNLFPHPLAGNKPIPLDKRETVINYYQSLVGADSSLLKNSVFADSSTAFQGTVVQKRLY